MPEIKITPEIPKIIAYLEKELEGIKAEIVADLAVRLPEEIKSSIAAQSPPLVQTGKLLSSIRGAAVSPERVEIEMVDYAFYLDPFFKAEGGGQSSKPFIETGISKALERIG